MSGRCSLLVCLDALLPVTHCDPEPTVRWPAELVSARRLLDAARASGGRVVHVLPLRPRAGSPGWTAGDLLAPQPSEPVFHRAGASALAAPGFREHVAAEASELVVVGRSVRRSCLATALACASLRLPVVVVRDALCAPPVEWSGLEGLRTLGQRTGTPLLRIVSSAQVGNPVPALRLIHGGRR